MPTLKPEDASDTESPRPVFDHGAYADEIRRRAGGIWPEAIAALAGRGPVPRRPYQVELHARQEGRAGCYKNCGDCCGRFLRCERGLAPETLLRLRADTLRMSVPSFVLSGTHTDPGCLEEEVLCRLLRMSAESRRCRQSTKLYTYGECLSPPVQDALIAAARAGRAGDSYVRLSMVTVDAGIFVKMCRPHHPDLSPADVLTRQHERARDLVRRVREESAPLGVGINCRLTKLNADGPEPIVELLRWFADNLPGPARMRFTTDYVPTLAPRAYRDHFFRDIHIGPARAGEIVRDAVRMAQITPEQQSRVSFRAVDPDSRQHTGLCFSQYLFAAISPEGLVYPCQGIAGKPFREVAYGDLKEKSFDQIWSDFREKATTDPSWPLRGGCEHCTAACERAMCEAGARELARMGLAKPELTEPTGGLPCRAHSGTQQSHLWGETKR